ncbi:MAG: GPW/gp25 family protein [Alphaproteobacteria bacterium]|nr:GPW/gp25 family protein [Alphaproteobacteria bacterium]MCB9697797.1 GPW/gp25 family protein [Alphaproteobacteria bacterium]
MEKEFLGRGWRFPFGFQASNGAVAMSEYEANIRECVTIILGTRPGERQMMPDFGCRIHELMFSPDTRATSSLIAHYVEEALIRWEPRVEVTKVDAFPDRTGGIRVLVHYRIKSTEELQELTLMLAG